MKISGGHAGPGYNWHESLAEMRREIPTHQTIATDYGVTGEMVQTCWMRTKSMQGHRPVSRTHRVDSIWLLGNGAGTPIQLVHHWRKLSTAHCQKTNSSAECKSSPGESCLSLFSLVSITHERFTRASDKLLHSPISSSAVVCF